ncbi:MAG: c-type cytochrome, partial [Verrucomicrobiota bacterium]
GWQLDPMKTVVTYVGETVDLSARGLMGNFTFADVWAKHTKSADDENLFALLERRLNDPDSNNAKQAAFFLRLLKDPRTDAQCAALIGGGNVVNAAPLKNATSTGITELPEAFKNLDWKKETASGDAKNGAALFAARGCAVCHSVKPSDAGGGGPALQGAASRFTLDYLVEAVITPNKTVSPIFRWTLVTKKDGTNIAGLITGETAGDIELLLPAGVRVSLKKELIAKQEQQDRSPMPEGLIQTTAELRDLLAYLVSLK